MRGLDAENPAGVFSGENRSVQRPEISPVNSVPSRPRRDEDSEEKREPEEKPGDGAASDRRIRPEPGSRKPFNHGRNRKMPKRASKARPTLARAAAGLWRRASGFGAGSLPRPTDPAEPKKNGDNDEDGGPDFEMGHAEKAGPIEADEKEADDPNQIQRENRCHADQDARPFDRQRSGIGENRRAKEPGGLDRVAPALHRDGVTDRADGHAGNVACPAQTIDNCVGSQGIGAQIIVKQTVEERQKNEAVVGGHQNDEL
jgi:hypothetical protein